VTAYDYVIVGAGSAGCVLANRLSAAGDVLVLEAGEPDEKREISVPIAYPELWGTSVDWDFRTLPQPELNDRTLTVSQGKTLGGSSSINAQMYFRGHPADYDGWAAAGNDGWDYDAVRERFERIEDGPGGPYGTGEPQHVAEQSDPHPLTGAFVDAAVETGLSRRECFNGGDLDGAGYTDVIQRDEKRHSAADAFLKPVLDRPGLTVETGARVHRVTFDGDRATGVEYERDGETGEVTADEVVLSAGAINSPHLLMRSGIGPASHLYEHDVDVRVDLPGVGHNLQDHPIVYSAYETDRGDTYGGADTLVNLLQYLVLKRGPLTSNGSEGAAYWRSDPNLDAPDVQFLFLPVAIERGEINEDVQGFSIATSLVAPESRGRVSLASADPDDDPRVDPQYLAGGDDDFETLFKGLERAHRIAEATPLASERAGEGWPHDDLGAHVRSETVSYQHFAGTCRMGDDEMAVVDDRLRVHGVENLRVVDASVMPTITRANTHAPTLAIAERAADFMVGDG
jgi:choline dehydrogenase